MREMLQTACRFAMLYYKVGGNKWNGKNKKMVILQDPINFDYY